MEYINGEAIFDYIKGGSADEACKKL